jgi:hypothetical protein
MRVLRDSASKANYTRNGSTWLVRISSGLILVKLPAAASASSDCSVVLDSELTILEVFASEFMGRGILFEHHR